MLRKRFFSKQKLFISESVFLFMEQRLRDIANTMRQDVLKMTTVAGSGHPTSCLSCAEIMSVLFFDKMKYDINNSENPDNDEFILSKGHAAPIWYSALFHSGCIKNNLMSLRKFSSDLEGHPIPRSLKWAKVATGSLGQGLGIGVGMALAAKIRGRKYKTYVLTGDSEMAEGSNYEAMQLATYYKLDNLCLIIDVNGLGQRGATMNRRNLKKYETEIKSFGWNAIKVDGHNILELKKAISFAQESRKPTAIIARTVKGKGVSFLEGVDGWHGKVLNKQELSLALDEIPKTKFFKFKIRKPKKIEVEKRKKKKLKLNGYEFGSEVATREGYGSGLANLAVANSSVIVVDGEVSNSTLADRIKLVRPKQFVEAFIAEQNLVSVCLGLSKKGFEVYGSSFAAFLTRAHDQIRMSALSSGNFTLCGSHAGVSIGSDGASQMGLEDISMFRNLPYSTVFYPSDAVSTEKIVALCSKIRGIKYIRTTRGKTHVIYSSKEKFEVGGFKILKQDSKDTVVLIGSGITLEECLSASEKVSGSAVVDLYCVKPFDSEKFIAFAKKHGGKVVIVEDHYRAGGIGEMLAEELENSGIKIKHLFVKGIPHSGLPGEMLKEYGIDSEAIVRETRKLLSS